jgi:hypothetical protein
MKDEEFFRCSGNVSGAGTLNQAVSSLRQNWVGA